MKYTIALLIVVMVPLGAFLRAEGDRTVSSKKVPPMGSAPIEEVLTEECSHTVPLLNHPHPVAHYLHDSSAPRRTGYDLFVSGRDRLDRIRVYAFAGCGSAAVEVTEKLGLPLNADQIVAITSRPRHWFTDDVRDDLAIAYRIGGATYIQQYYRLKLMKRGDPLELERPKGLNMTVKSVLPLRRQRWLVGRLNIDPDNVFRLAHVHDRQGKVKTSMFELSASGTTCAIDGVPFGDNAQLVDMTPGPDDTYLFVNTYETRIRAFRLDGSEAGTHGSIPEYYVPPPFEACADWGRDEYMDPAIHVAWNRSWTPVMKINRLEYLEDPYYVKDLELNRLNAEGYHHALEFLDESLQPIVTTSVPHCIPLDASGASIICSGSDPLRPWNDTTVYRYRFDPARARQARKKAYESGERDRNWFALRKIPKPAPENFKPLAEEEKEFLVAARRAGTAEIRSGSVDVCHGNIDLAARNVLSLLQEAGKDHVPDGVWLVLYTQGSLDDGLVTVTSIGKGLAMGGHRVAVRLTNDEEFATQFESIFPETSSIAQ